MDTSNSTSSGNASISTVDFVLGRGEGLKPPTATEYTSILLAATAKLMPNLSMLGFKVLDTQSGLKIDRLVAAHVGDDIAGIRMKFLHVDRFTNVFYLTEDGRWMWAGTNVDGDRILEYVWLDQLNMEDTFNDRRKVSALLPECLLSALYKLYSDAMLRNQVHTAALRKKIEANEVRNTQLRSDRQQLDEWRTRLASLPEH